MKIGFFKSIWNFFQSRKRKSRHDRLLDTWAGMPELAKEWKRAPIIPEYNTFTDSDIAVLIQSATPSMNMHTASICAGMILEKFDGMILVKDTCAETFEDAMNGYLESSQEGEIPELDLELKSFECPIGEPRELGIIFRKRM